MKKHMNTRFLLEMQLLQNTEILKHQINGQLIRGQG